MSFRTEFLPSASRFFSQSNALSGSDSDSVSDSDREIPSPTMMVCDDISESTFLSKPLFSEVNSLPLHTKSSTEHFPSLLIEDLPKPDLAGFDGPSFQQSCLVGTPEKVGVLKKIAKESPYHVSQALVKAVKSGFSQLNQLPTSEKRRHKREIRKIIFENASENYSRIKESEGGSMVPFSPVKRQKTTHPIDSPSKSPSKWNRKRHRELYSVLGPNSIDFAILKKTYDGQPFGVVNTRHIFEGDHGVNGSGKIKGKHVFRGKKDQRKIVSKILSSQHGVSNVVWKPEIASDVTKTSTAFCVALSDEQILSRIIKSTPIAQVANTQLRKGDSSDYYEVYLGEGSPSKINSAFPLFYYSRYLSKGSRGRGLHRYQIQRNKAEFCKKEIKQAIITVVEEAFKKLQAGVLNGSENPIRYFLKDKGHIAIDIAPAIFKRTGVKKGIFFEVSFKDGLKQEINDKIRALGIKSGVLKSSVDGS